MENIYGKDKKDMIKKTNKINTLIFIRIGIKQLVPKKIFPIGILLPRRNKKNEY